MRVSSPSLAVSRCPKADGGRWQGNAARLFRRPGCRAVALAWLLAACAAPVAALAHDLITTESAARYLAQADAQLEIARSRQGAEKRAQANYALGRMLDEICELLNLDLAAHGQVQGLATEYLVRELQARRLDLLVSPALRRFPANLGYYREALRLSPDGPLAGEAMLQWLRGQFYDSFRDDPLQPFAQSFAELEQQIALGERFLARHPEHAGREEAQFIVLVYLVRAAHAGPDAGKRRAARTRAREVARDFGARYGESMRAAAVPVLLETLQGTD